MSVSPVKSQRKSGDTLVVALFFFSLADPFLWFEDATDKTLRTPQKRLIPEWLALAAMPTQLLQFFFS